MNFLTLLVFNAVDRIKTVNILITYILKNHPFIDIHWPFIIIILLEHKGKIYILIKYQCNILIYLTGRELIFFVFISGSCCKDAA